MENFSFEGKLVQEAGGANDPFNRCSAVSHNAVPLATALHSNQTICKHKQQTNKQTTKTSKEQKKKKLM